MEAVESVIVSLSVIGHWAISIFVVLSLLVIGFVFGVLFAIHHMNKQLCKEGLGKYEADEDGDVRFVLVKTGKDLL